METVAGAALLCDREAGLNFVRRLLFEAACYNPVFSRRFGLELDAEIRRRCANRLRTRRSSTASNSSSPI